VFAKFVLYEDTVLVVVKPMVLKYYYFAYQLCFGGKEKLHYAFKLLLLIKKNTCTDVERFDLSLYSMEKRINQTLFIHSMNTA